MLEWLFQPHPSDRVAAAPMSPDWSCLDVALDIEQRSNEPIPRAQELLDWAVELHTPNEAGALSDPTPARRSPE